MVKTKQQPIVSAIEFRCSFCGVDPGNPCRMLSGRDPDPRHPRRFHYSRIEEATGFFENIIAIRRKAELLYVIEEEPW